MSIEDSKQPQLTQKERTHTMDFSSFFSQDAKDLVSSKLEAFCAQGGSITRANLALELGLTEPLPPEVKKVDEPAKVLNLDATDEEKAAQEAAVKAFADYEAYQAHCSRNAQIEAMLGSMVSLQVIPGYENRKGPGGGIGRVGERAAKEKGKAAPRTVKFPDGFLNTLRDVLHTEIPMGSGSKTRLTRKEIVQRMNTRDPSIQPGSDVENLVSAALRQGELEGYEAFRGVDGGIGLGTSPVAVGNPQPAAPETTSEETAQASDSAPVSADASAEVSSDTESTTPASAPAPKTGNKKKSKKN